MNIIVCIKQVPDTNEVKINQETGTLIREGVPSIINPDDKNALEAALQLKDSGDAKVSVLTMGPPQAKEVLLEALSMGADDAYLVSDRKFGGSDTWATATILAAAIKKIGHYDVVLCGRQAIDGDTAQVGPEIAEFLDIPQITYVKGIKRVENNTLEVRRFSEYGDFIYKVGTPVLLTAIKELNKPRYPTVKGVLTYYADEEPSITTFSFQDLTIDKTQIGLKGSPTNVFRSFVPTKSKATEILEGVSANEKADLLVHKLAELNLV